MSKHTPGPWKVVTRKSFDAECGEIGRVLSVLIGDVIIDITACGYANRISEETMKKEHDTQLIAAAPEMLGALEKVFRMSNDSNANPHEVLARVSQVAEEAINKAEGKEQE